ncbi:uncharacterized protein SPPG_04584 [Spizellomyces punctatus DAOM BR117]|uniref:Tubby C-terminal domain-containing protein n=1 Tax=Spizellomyces punctatus (strain DAOM BR117) TaxID=645134 RepID=A0A0L0HGN9_SPIPD|nr:uncharacterized protein SPPG_04584 [Spizellomyces punctatus DAOM BR117]KND00253.1 hypothetical protein SPPG_04584 [Spizellomyces punctatus DAOM BR117]|eukprot:XP_016608292.1 hypothetical protein SPPG_04584 [Spizellomyces punctatus DAOM BR117]
MGGDISKFEAVQLQPLPHPIAAVDQRFCLQQPVSLLIKEKIFSFSGDDFSIKDATTGQVYFKVDGRALLSLREKKTFLDAYGQPIMNMKQQLLAFVPNHTLYYGNDSQNKILDIRAHFTLMKPKLSVNFTDKISGIPCEIGLKGNWLARRSLIWIDIGCKGEANRIFVAKVTSPLLTGRTVFFDKSDYLLTVMPGIDIALLVAICVALDERSRDK